MVIMNNLHLPELKILLMEASITNEKKNVSSNGTMIFIDIRSKLNVSRLVYRKSKMKS